MRAVAERLGLGDQWSAPGGSGCPVERVPAEAAAPPLGLDEAGRRRGLALAQGADAREARAVPAGLVCAPEKYAEPMTPGSAAYGCPPSAARQMRASSVTAG